MIKQTRKIAILGAGSWGTALASTFSMNGNQVILWGKNQSDIDDINQNHQNRRFLQEAFLDKNLKATTDLKDAVKDAEIVLFVVPTSAVRQVAGKLASILPSLKNEIIFGHAIKGIEVDSNKRVSQMISEEIPSIKEDNLFFISGPSHAESVVKRAITLVAVASSNQARAAIIQAALSNSFFRVYTNSDLCGSEYAAALKNVLAIAGGIIKGLKMTDNTQAALVTRGLSEMRRLGVALGGKSETFNGLAGLGDLIVTAMSTNSRNFRAGLGLASGKDLKQVQKEMGMVIEGVKTAKAVDQLSRKNNISMPISESVYKILYENAKIDDVVADLMNRPLISEE
ncbi:NAD(P)H-dependent glycerol-3-phosphate dehydrogenase [Oenococcus oeni]|uniref:NAD(P)H-dependent glycerol-3-phosphate dehydrogenase n=1 Tax=Oenococcus oeni TaxID=1247 RepID=UPI0008F930B8|nr:NAD(P)H-dependent glycerol-3-phosphate dehydrogenase [Oenococcus oeni]OIK99053.1 glycerol-3-phosphate dehydrogenase [Oenococcus oeni]